MLWDVLCIIVIAGNGLLYAKTVVARSALLLLVGPATTAFILNTRTSVLRGTVQCLLGLCAVVTSLVHGWESVLRIRVRTRIHMFLCLSDPYPLGRCIIKQKYEEKKFKNLFFYIFVTLFELFIFSRWFKCRYLQKVICRQNRFCLVSITKILGSGLFFRICPSLNLHKEKKGAGAKKAPSKPPVTCEQCGITVVNKHVLKRHVSTIFRR